MPKWSSAPAPAPNSPRQGEPVETTDIAIVGIQVPANVDAEGVDAAINF